MGIEGGQVQLVALGREFLCRVRVAYVEGGGMFVFNFGFGFFWFFLVFFFFPPL
jgi:hypothetical protein